MKSIEQGAQEYADKTYPKMGLNDDWADDGFDEGFNAAKNRLSISDFTAGVEFAQQWTLMSDELPAIGIEIIVKSEKHKIITTPKTHDMVHWCSENFTHWRCVEIK